MSDITFDKGAELFALGTLSAGNKTGVRTGKGDYKAVLIVTAKTGTSPTLDVHLEESNDDSSYTDVGGGVFSQYADAIGRKDILVRITKKYVRVVSAVGGTGSPAFTAQVLLNPIP